MDFDTVQICRSTDGWSPIRVPSSSDPETNHLVLVNPYVSIKEFVCDCEGFHYRGTCSHQKKALEQVCWWPLAKHQQKQTYLEERAMECPNCGGETRFELWRGES